MYFPRNLLSPSHSTIVYERRLTSVIVDERAFQKQDAVFIGAKRLLGKKTSKKALRYWRSVGLGFKVPSDAKDGKY